MAANTATCLGTSTAEIEVNGERRYSVNYQVVTTSASDQALTAMQAAGIPSIGEYYVAGNDSDTGAYVKSYNANLQNQEGSRKVWVVTVNYSSAGMSSSPDQNSLTYEYPWLMPAEISMSGVVQQFRLKETQVNNTTRALVKNSAGQVIEDEYVDWSYPVIRIVKNYRAIDIIDTIAEYTNTVNSKTFFGSVAGMYRLFMPNVRIMYTGQGIRYYEIAYEFQGNYFGWNSLRVPDAGYYHIDATSGKLRINYDEETGLPMGKRNLDAAGNMLDPAVAPRYITPLIKPYREKDFGDLGIPTRL